MMSKALEALLTACAESSDAKVRALAEKVRKPRGRGQPKAVLPTLEEAMLPGSADAFVAWHATPPTDEPKSIWSETEVCRQIASNHGVSTNTVKPLVRAIHARLNPPKVLGFSIAEQLEMAHKAVKK